jgi:hypothetical protein
LIFNTGQSIINPDGEKKAVAHYTQYLAYHVGLLQNFKAAIQKQPPYHTNLADLTEMDTKFMQVLDELCEVETYSEDVIAKGQWLVERIISGYNQFMPVLPRDLLWFFGGDCLHYMPDDEIRFYQQLDELRHAAESQNKEFNVEEAKDYLNRIQQ